MPTEVVAILFILLIVCAITALWLLIWKLFDAQPKQSRWFTYIPLTFVVLMALFLTFAGSNWVWWVIKENF